MSPPSSESREGGRAERSALMIESLLRVRRKRKEMISPDRSGERKGGKGRGGERRGEEGRGEQRRREGGGRGSLVLLLWDKVEAGRGRSLFVVSVPVLNLLKLRVAGWV